MAHDLTPPLNQELPGDEVVSVEIRVNGIIVYKRDAVLNRVLGGSTGRYKTDDGEKFTFNRTRGVLDLAGELLKEKGDRR